MKSKISGRDIVGRGWAEGEEMRNRIAGEMCGHWGGVDTGKWRKRADN